MKPIKKVVGSSSRPSPFVIDGKGRSNNWEVVDMINSKNNCIKKSLFM